MTDSENNSTPVINETSRTRPRKIPVIKPSKYDTFGALHTNKKYWNEVFEDLDSHFKAPTQEKESSGLSQVLPGDLYEKVCSTLDIPVIKHNVEVTKQVYEQKPRRMIKDPLITFRSSIHVDREADSDTDVEYSGSDDEEPNMYQVFLKRPLREQITWDSHFLLPEREDEKGLVKKADDLTDTITNEFCKYMGELGGKQQSQLFTPKAVKELFQIEFDYHVSRSLRVVPKLLPAVNEKIANATGNSNKSFQAMLEREILRDVKTESRPDNVSAFGRSLPQQDQWRAPRNDTEATWSSARRVPQDLVTLKTVWEGITNLKSVREYCRWMIEHPEYRRAPYLNSLGMFDQAVLEARRTLDLNLSDLDLKLSDLKACDLNLKASDHKTCDLDLKLSDLKTCDLDLKASDHKTCDLDLKLSYLKASDHMTCHLDLKPSDLKACNLDLKTSDIKACDFNLKASDPNLNSSILDLKGSNLDLNPSDLDLKASELVLGDSDRTPAAIDHLRRRLSHLTDSK